MLLSSNGSGTSSMHMVVVFGVCAHLMFFFFLATAKRKKGAAADVKVCHLSYHHNPPSPLLLLSVKPTSVFIMLLCSACSEWWTAFAHHNHCHFNQLSWYQCTVPTSQVEKCQRCMHVAAFGCRRRKARERRKRRKRRRKCGDGELSLRMHLKHCSVLPVLPMFSSSPSSLVSLSLSLSPLSLSLSLSLSLLSLCVVLPPWSLCVPSCGVDDQRNDPRCARW